MNLDNDILGIPLATVIIGSIANAFLLIVLLIILNDRTRGKSTEYGLKMASVFFFLSNLVRSYTAAMILALLTILVEFFLMLGLILCVAFCSGFITLAITSLDKGN